MKLYENLKVSLGPESSDIQCPICFETFHEDDFVIQLKCSEIHIMLNDNCQDIILILELYVITFVKQRMYFLLVHLQAVARHICARLASADCPRKASD